MSIDGAHTGGTKAIFWGQKKGCSGCQLLAMYVRTVGSGFVFPQDLEFLSLSQFPM